MPRDKRRVEEGAERTYEVKELWDQHHEIIDLIALSYENVEIAAMTGYTPQMVSYIRNSPVVRERITQLQGEITSRTIDIATRVRQFEPVALAHLEQIILGNVDGVSQSLRARTCENYLARGAHGPIQKIASITGHLTREDIEELKNRKEEAKRAAMEQGAMEVSYVDMLPQP